MKYTRNAILLSILLAAIAAQGRSQCNIQAYFYPSSDQLSWINEGAFANSYEVQGTGNGPNSVSYGYNLGYISQSGQPTNIAALTRIGGNGVKPQAGLYQTTYNSFTRQSFALYLFDQVSAGTHTLIYGVATSSGKGSTWTTVGQVTVSAPSPQAPLYLRIEPGSGNWVGSYSLDGATWTNLGTAGAGNATYAGLWAASGDHTILPTAALFTRINFNGNGQPAFTDADEGTVGTAGKGGQATSVQFNPENSSFSVVPYINNGTCTPGQLAQLQSEIQNVQASADLTGEIGFHLENAEIWSSFTQGYGKGYPIPCAPNCVLSLNSAYVFTGVGNFNQPLYFAEQGTGYIWYAGSVIYIAPNIGLIAYSNPQTF